MGTEELNPKSEGVSFSSSKRSIISTNDNWTDLLHYKSNIDARLNRLFGYKAEGYEGDGGLTNSLRYNFEMPIKSGLETKFGTFNYLSASVSHNMYSPHGNGGEIDWKERPYNGIFEVNTGLASANKAGENTRVNATILTAGIRETNVTNSIHNGWHNLTKSYEFDSPREYTLPIMPVLTAALATEFRHDEDKKGHFINGGISIGSYTGANIGAGIHIGSLKPATRFNTNNEDIPLNFTPDIAGKGFAFTARIDLNYTAKSPVMGYTKNAESYSNYEYKKKSKSGPDELIQDGDSPAHDTKKGDGDRSPTGRYELETVHIRSTKPRPITAQLGLGIITSIGGSMLEFGITVGTNTVKPTEDIITGNSTRTKYSDRTDNSVASNGIESVTHKEIFSEAATKQPPLRVNAGFNLTIPIGGGRGKGD